MRRAALKSVESKRHTRLIDGAVRGREAGSPFEYDVSFYELGRVDQMESGDHDTAAYKQHRVGRFINAVGLKLEVHFHNELETQSILVRMVIGYKRRERVAEANGTVAAWTDANRKIFKRRKSEQNVLLNNWLGEDSLPEYYSTHATLDRRYIKVYKDIKLKMPASTVDNGGADSSNFSVYIPLKNRPIKFREDASETALDVDWMPCVWIWACSADQQELNALTIMNYNMYSTLYFKDPG